MAQSVQYPHFRQDENASVGYESFFIMEPDTTPWQHGWLTSLVNEIKAKAPFAMLGSKYHGYKWHDFEEGLPLPLLHHLNGNAVYNTSHPLLRLILNQLKAEMDSIHNMIPFDLRIGQIWTEGLLGYDRQKKTCFLGHGTAPI